MDEAGRAVAKGFEEEIKHAIDHLLENPMTGVIASYGLRGHPLHRFPYTIYYRVESDILRIFAIAHQSRRPDY